MPVVWLSPKDPLFPDPCNAESEPDGLLAIGGNLEPSTLLNAYQAGIFPWYQHGDPLLWWSPAVRCVLEPSRIHVSRSLRKLMRRDDYRVTTNRAFEDVMRSCSAERNPQQTGTWITAEMIEAYTNLHRCGLAHSIEVWGDDQLVGGLYGVAMGGIFCGESMFSRVASSSKIALVCLSQRLAEAKYDLIDCQLPTSHLLSMGAASIERKDFIERLKYQVNRDLAWPAFDNDTPASVP